MKKTTTLLTLMSLLFFSSLLFSKVATAGQAGVGVLNVPPEYRSVRLVQQDNNIRIYLTLSDYNSWEDLYEVNIILEYYGTEMATFNFKQYEDTTSFIKTNEFSETSRENNLLQTEKLSYYSSNEKETVDDRCNLELLFVFRTTWFTNLKIIASDREGLTATTNIDYDTEEMMRSSNMIIIPGIDGPILVEISGLILNLISLFAGATGVIYFAKKTGIIKVGAHEEPQQ
jgi:hypothetical protein